MQTGAKRDDLTEIKDLLSANKAIGSEKGDIADLVSVSSAENVRGPVCQARGCKVPKSVSTEIANLRDHQSSRPPIIATTNHRDRQARDGPNAAFPKSRRFRHSPKAGCLRTMNAVRLPGVYGAVVFSPFSRLLSASALNLCYNKFISQRPRKERLHGTTNCAQGMGRRRAGA